MQNIVKQLPDYKLHFLDYDSTNELHVQAVNVATQIYKDTYGLFNKKPEPLQQEIKEKMYLYL